jgi:hypothetical protein
VRTRMRPGLLVRASEDFTSVTVQPLSDQNIIHVSRPAQSSADSAAQFATELDSPSQRFVQHLTS